jgi:hypothetical protein
MGRRCCKRKQFFAKSFPSLFAKQSAIADNFSRNLKARS